jgi:hypothetical protein
VLGLLKFCVLCSSGLFWLTAASAQSRVVVHKCTDADGKLSFQQQPCPPRSQASRLAVEGDIDPAVAQAARERAAANAPKVSGVRDLTELPQTQSPRPTQRPVRCPATRENPGVINVVGTDPWSMAVARSIYNELPSETTLKNSGRWPKDCVR